MARILTNATTATNCVRFPEGWQEIWPTAYHDLTNASRTRKMVHDDIEDALSGVCERILAPQNTFAII
jgi:hypothetical protein